MKNNKVLYGLMGIIALAVVNTVIFLAVKDFNTAKWINIGFINFAIIVTWIGSISFGDSEDQFMNYTRLPMISTYSIITIIIGAIFLLINVQNVSLTIIVHVILLGIFTIILLSNTMANNSAKEMTSVDRNNYNKVADMTKRLETILNNTDNRDVYKAIEKAYDSVKNTKVTVKADSTQIDNDIIQAIGIIEVSKANDDINAINEQVKRINELINQRNMM